MCGRFTLRASTIELRNAFPFADLPELGPRYNVSPTQQVAAIRRDADSPAPEFAWLRWGFLAPWAKSPKDRPQPINAKSETVAQSRMFAKSLQARRCLLLADGFYEWRSEGKAKQPFYIRMKDEKPFAFAGIWTAWHGKGGETVESCTILTTEANELLGQLHNRMPVILDAADYTPWLDTSSKDASAVAGLLVPFLADRMKFDAVGQTVNNARNEGAACIEPARPMK
jgi:putative SOS response-associated peptidase YedK